MGLQCRNGFFMGLQWDSHGFGVLRWVSHGTLTGFPRVSHGSSIGLQWASYETGTPKGLMYSPGNFRGYLVGLWGLPWDFRGICHGRS